MAGFTLDLDEDQRTLQTWLHAFAAGQVQRLIISRAVSGHEIP